MLSRPLSQSTIETKKQNALYFVSRLPLSDLAFPAALFFFSERGGLDELNRTKELASRSGGVVALQESQQRRSVVPGSVVVTGSR